MSRRRRQSKKKIRKAEINDAVLTPSNIHPLRWITPWLMLMILYGMTWLKALSSEGMQNTLLATISVSVLWLLILHRKKKPLLFEWNIQRAHWIQMCMHSAVFIYWGMYDPLIEAIAPFILVQLPIAYLLDLLLCWSRGRVWYLGLGPIPIIGSLNLFLWFKEPYFHWQIGMIVLAFCGRELLQWKRHGVQRHIFNPSAFALAIASIAVICTDRSVSHTWGQEIATHLQIAPYMFELIFVLGMIVQSFFGVVWTTLSAALTLWGLGSLWTAYHGTWFFTDTAIPISVFLGMNLLITDPKTSPQNAFGKILFGMLYGACVMPIYLGLLVVGQPAYFDKLLQVPLCNLLVPLFERWGDKIHLRFKGILRALPTVLTKNPRKSIISIWGLCFLSLRPELVSHPGLDSKTWEVQCRRGELKACKNLWYSLEKGCGLGRNEHCLEWARRLSNPEALNRDIDQAVSIVNASCKRGHEASCQLKKELLKPLDLEKIENKDTEELVIDINPPALTCAQGDGETCLEEARILIKENANPEQIAERFKLACTQQQAVGCANLGLMHLQNRIEGANPKQARQYHADACHLGLAKACGRLAVLYAQGIGGAVDTDQAQLAFQRACEGGDDVSCLALQP